MVKREFLKFDLIVVTELCNVTVDLRDLPTTAWKKGEGGRYYQASYAIGLTFGPELILSFMSGDQIIERKYVRYH